MSSGTSDGFLLDVGVLVALTNPDHVHHHRARQWFAGVKAWVTTPLTEASFLRLMLNPAVAGAPRTVRDVIAVLSALRAQPGHRFLADDSSLLEPSIDVSGLIGHQQVTDFHLVSLAARHALAFATLDTRIKPALVQSEQHLVHVV